MTRADLMLFLPAVAQSAFVFALGASLGSLINVLAYRIPKGLGVVTPPSRCPHCQTRLTWRENIPILGWILLRGKCRFCKAPISPEYPIVEAFVAVLFTTCFALWYLIPDNAAPLGLPIGAVAPEWTRSGLLLTWPALAALLILLASLTAMTIIDARTYTIPLAIAWFPTALAFLTHPAHALALELLHGPLQQLRPGLWFAPDGTRWYSAPNWAWTLPTPSTQNWWAIGAALGGVLGVPTSLLLQKLRLIGHSFADYEAWETKALADAAADPHHTSGDDPAHLWIQYPHARREMFTEAAFIAPIVLLAIGGAWLSPRLVAHFAGPWQPAGPGIPGLVPPVDAPLWLAVLAGVCFGALIGGGVVWAVRIAGTLVFGKEAMGIGDVHLMAAVGACLGWIDAVLAFFGAAFVGLAYALAGPLLGGRMKRAMPFGPFLAVSTLLVLLLKPGIEIVLGRLLGSAGPIDLP